MMKTVRIRGPMALRRLVSSSPCRRYMGVTAVVAAMGGRIPRSRSAKPAATAAGAPGNGPNHPLPRRYDLGNSSEVTTSSRP
jgi:hypothetical protein